MENNLDEDLFVGQQSDNDESTPMTPDEVSQILARIAADQTATRGAVEPPWWYVLIVSLCMGGLFVVFAIPESLVWLKFCVEIAIIAVLLFIILWSVRHRSVKVGKWTLFAPFRRGSIPLILLFAVFAALLLMEPFSGLPWWAHLCVGACVAVVAYPVVRWSWRNWTSQAR